MSTTDDEGYALVPQHLRRPAMPMSKILALRSGDNPGMTVGESLPLIREKISTGYEDAGEGLRAYVARNGSCIAPLVINQGRLDDGHRRVAAAHDQGITELPYRRGAWGPGNDI